MNWWLLGVIVVVILIVFALYLSNTAGRLDRLHKKIDTAELALEAHLANRTAVCLELAGSGLLDPASSLLLAEAAHDARTAKGERRAMAESDLTASLEATFADPEDVESVLEEPDGVELLDDLAAACRRVALSRIFLNDAVLSCRQIRSRGVVRAFSLAGHTPWPTMWEMNDAVPVALTMRMS